MIGAVGGSSLVALSGSVGQVVRLPVFQVALTLGAYVAARALWERSGRHPLANPVLVSIVLVASAIRLLGVDYATYAAGATVISLLLGPATVALGLLLHRERAILRRSALALVGGAVAGSTAAAAAAFWVTRGLGGDRVLALSMAPKSATTPVAIAVSQSIGGIPSLSTVFALGAGILGAVAGPAILRLVRVHHPQVQGLAMGVASHGIGSARMVHEGPTEGAFAGLGLALSALTTSVVLPLLVHWMH